MNLQKLGGGKSEGDGPRTEGRETIVFKNKQQQDDRLMMLLFLCAVEDTS